MSHEATIRLSSFLGLLILFSLWELIYPRRMLTTSKRRRWINNLSLVMLDAFLVRLLFPLLPIGMASLAQSRGWGVLTTIPSPALFSIIASVVLLDLVIYCQHMIFHALSFLWRFHLVHHIDLDLDVTSGVRFHPIEIIISMGIKLLAVALLGVPPLGVLIFEVVLNGASMFNHSNIYIPSSIDRILRVLLVTPDMHRVHHSIILKEMNSNFGFTLSWWDQLFNTYRAQPAEGHEEMKIGYAPFFNKKGQQLWWLLAAPFMRGVTRG